ncbi:unnamed protein product [marine sediment metagenome]|uniref:Uncharacterized protein n=1 Tax=marine sediment metagenome TaxID=412755 RepID=X0X7E3_9ZZZZ
MDEFDIVIVENVGNLVCPAGFDIGEDAKAAALSVTEGEDKPLKYPFIFKESKAVILTKMDLLPHLEFDLDACLGFVRQINSEVPIHKVSALTGDGMGEFAEWLEMLK